MHQGRPYGLHVIGGKLTSRDEAFISVNAKRFSNLKDLSAIDSARLVYDLPDGGYVVIQDMGNNFRIIAYKTSEIALIAADGMATDYIPMLYSGVVFGATPFKNTGVAIRLTETSRRRLVDYDGAATLPPKELQLQRFEVEYDANFKYFEPKNKGNRVFTQYHKLRSTWYSGAMSEVVQIIGGYGRQDTDDLPDDLLERKRFNLPARYQKSVRAQTANQRLPGYKGIPDFEGKYKYEYTHQRTHAVSFDDQGDPWLVQIDASGVYAMPLPMIPATTAPAFLSYIKEVEDDELIHIVERFGGLPSGEPFPKGESFQAWYRAGVIIKVCETKGFYKHFPIYDACGWAFNSSGSEGFNTGFSFDETNMRYVYGFKIKLNLGAAKNRGMTPNAKKVNDATNSALLNKYISNLFKQLDLTDDRSKAIRYKIMRSPTHVLLANAKLGKDLEYWENLISDPIANHSGSVSQVSKGTLYWSGKNKKVFGNLKFPVITGDGCESFDLTIPDYNGPVLKCDTVVFGCYIKDQLKVIKFFIDERGFQPKPVSNFERDMIVGKWESREYGYSILAGHLYTTDFDDRKAVTTRETSITLTGEDLGYGNPRFITPPIFKKWGLLTRSKYYSHHTLTTVTANQSVHTATCVPVFERSCILYVCRDGYDGGYVREEMKRLSMQDPTSYDIWTYDPYWHYEGLDGRGEPKPTIGEYVYANYDPAKNYKPTDRNSFADSGNWYGVPPNSFKDVSGICAKYTSRNSPHSANGVVVGGEAPLIATYDVITTMKPSITEALKISIDVGGAVTTSNKNPDDFYFVFSPIEDAAGYRYFYREATKITFGKRAYATVNEQSSNGQPLYWGLTSLTNNNSLPCFIGVINE